MQTRIWPIVVALVLLTVGFVGFTVTAIVMTSGTVVTTPSTGSGRRGSATFGGFTSNGERIYYTGVGRNGPIQRELSPPRGFGGMMGGRGMMAGAGCVVCHRSDGRGGRIAMMGIAVDIPDITYAALTSPHTDETTTTPGWDDPAIADAIRDGVEPDGERLDPFMPRWDMDDTDMSDTIDYLKELSGR